LSEVKRTSGLRPPAYQFDAVDGSSTGTSVPWMWALLRLPRFRGASHADDNDNRIRYRQVGSKFMGLIPLAKRSFAAS